MLPKSKEPKKLQAKDHFAKEWEATLHNLGTQQTKILREDAKRTRESAQIDLILGFYRRLWRSSKKLQAFVTIGFFIYGTLGVNLFLIPFLLSIQQEYHWSKRKICGEGKTLSSEEKNST